MQKIKIIVVDDHEIFRKGLTMILNRLKNVKVVAEASSGEELLRIIGKHDAEIILMDIEMNGLSGIETTKLVLEKYPDMKIIALSMFADDNYVQNMIDVGAKGFLIKNVKKEGIEKAIDLISKGANYFSDELWTFFTQKVKPQKKHSPADNFTKRELEVLNLICEGFTNEEIAAKLFISERTVIGHKSKLIAKAECRNSVQLVSYAVKNKLVHL